MTQHKKITFVKKILANGEACKKCKEVEQKLIEKDQMQFIDQVLYAEENDMQSEGSKLAEQLEVTRAPFFVVEEAGKPPIVYTVYLKFVREVLQEATDSNEELKETLRNHDDLDFL